MKIGLDVSSLVYRRGVSRYTSNLMLALLELPGVELLLYGNSLRAHRQLSEELREKLKNTTPDKYDLFLGKIPPRILAKLWALGLQPLSKTMPDVEVFHSWDWLQPPDKDLPLVSTIHDLAILKYPETAHPRVLAAHQRSWKILKERKAQILTVTQASKNEIIKLLQIPPERITVTYEALPRAIQETSDYLAASDELRVQLKRKLNLTRPYILFVGSREPRKNLERLIKAWEPLAGDFDLIVAGEKAWDKSRQLHQQHLRFLGQVDDLELAALYHYAELLAYPSLDEGFGLPILEAFSHGVPVLSSDIPVIKEVAGNAALLVNPNSIEDIRSGLKKLLGEDKAASATRLQRMIIRLHLFNWSKTARTSLDVYRRAIEEKQS
jgi:glycosyltransferase involved in cell wall biosynthesis